MLDKYDIAVIILIIVIISIIIIINVKKVLNDKLTNVEIKVPEIEIPQSNIIVKVQKKCDVDEYDVHVHQNDNLTFPAKKIGLHSKIEGFEDTKKDTVLFAGETLPIVNQETYVIQQYKNLFPSDENNIVYPDFDQIVNNTNNNSKNVIDKGNYVCVEKSYFNKLNGIFDPKETKNHNTETVQNLIKNDFKNNPNDISNINAELEINDKWDPNEEMNYMQYFMKQRRFVQSSFEDGVTKGGNIADYNEYGGLNDIGKIQLGKHGALPKGTNYIFPPT